jgi:UDP-2,3-diacylglucosamine hydrolase
VDGRLFPEELNIPVFHDNQEYTFGETFLIGHGDGKVLEI